MFYSLLSSQFSLTALDPGADVTVSSLLGVSILVHGALALASGLFFLIMANSLSSPLFAYLAARAALNMSTSARNTVVIGRFSFCCAMNGGCILASLVVRILSYLVVASRIERPHHILLLIGLGSLSRSALAYWHIQTIMPKPRAEEASALERVLVCLTEARFGPSSAAVAPAPGPLRSGPDEPSFSRREVAGGASGGGQVGSDLKGSDRKRPESSRRREAKGARRRELREDNREGSGGGSGGGSSGGSKEGNREGSRKFSRDRTSNIEEGSRVISERDVPGEWDSTSAGSSVSSRSRVTMAGAGTDYFGVDEETRWGEGESEAVGLALDLGFDNLPEEVEEVEEDAEKEREPEKENGLSEEARTVTEAAETKAAHPSG